MAEVDEKVMGFVERILDQEPEIRLEDLYERAKEFKRSVGRLSKRQFNARYPLQVKRRRALAARKREPVARRGRTPSSRRGPRSGRPAETSRDTIRQVLLQFASDIAAAEERKDLVKVLAAVDLYVDRVLDGVTKA